MDIPVPKYRIGDTVWYPYSEVYSDFIDCSDCCGTAEWEAKLPNGEVLQIECSTCAGYLESSGTQRVMSCKHYASELTIGSVRIDTADRDGRLVSYMCKETGIGSGSIYYEDRIFSNKESALKMAKFEAHEKLTRLQGKEDERRAKEKKRTARKPSLEKRKIKALEKELKELKKGK